MDAAHSIPATAVRALPAGPTFAKEMETFYRQPGIVPPTAEEIANVAPWTEEEADAFERAINKACEQVDETCDGS